MVRRDEYFERFREMTSERGWTEEQQMFLGRMVVSSCGSTELLERMSREIFQIEDNINAEKTERIYSEYDRVFSKEEFSRTDQYRQAQIPGWDTV